MKNRFLEPDNYWNRELSWILFNKRVLHEARDKHNPLWERLKFLSITASNLDEFFMVGVASLKDMVNAGYTRKDIAGLTPVEDNGRVYFEEARMALDVGKIFFEDKDIIAYAALGIGRLIYQLPIPLCKMFIKEIFGGRSPDDFDEETLMTINKFFENNLNVSETSRQLYIHRNTLVYRLDKLQKSTGLDLRIFEDAITFKIALMVVQYMKYMETMDY